MPNVNSKAFSLIELLAVLAIMTVVIAIILSVRSPNPETSKKSILAGLNNIINVARQEAFATRKNHRILFIEKRDKPTMIVVQRKEIDKDNPKKLFYVNIEPLAFSIFVLPNKIDLHAIYINGKEQWNENKVKGVEVLVVPDGALPDLALQFSIFESNEEERISYILQPYIGRFIEVNGWVKALSK